MDHYSSPGGTWTMIPTPNSNSQIQSQSNQDLYLQQQQQQFLHQQSFQQPQTPNSQFQQQQQQQQQLILQQQQQNLHQSLASHFHLLNLVENLAELVEHGNPDQQSDTLIAELSNHFDKCQQLLNSISASITKAMTVEGQKKKLEESEQLLNQRRDLIANYSKSVEELVGSEP